MNCTSGYLNWLHISTQNDLGISYTLENGVLLFSQCWLCIWRWIERLVVCIFPQQMLLVQRTIYPHTHTHTHTHTHSKADKHKGTGRNCCPISVIVVIVIPAVKLHRFFIYLTLSSLPLQTWPIAPFLLSAQIILWF